MRHVRGEAALSLEVALEVGRHLVKGLSELVYLIVTAHVGAGRKIALADAAGSIGDGAHGLGEHARHQEAHDDRYGNGDERREPHGVEGALAKCRIGLGEQGIAAEHP